MAQGLHGGGHRGADFPGSSSGSSNFCSQGEQHRHQFDVANSVFVHCARRRQQKKNEMRGAQGKFIPVDAWKIDVEREHVKLPAIT